MAAEGNQKIENPMLIFQDAMLSSTRISCVMRFTEREGFFDGRDATRYLREFSRSVQVLRLSVNQMKLEFESVTEQKIQPRVRQITAKPHGTWELFAADLKEMFRARDTTRVTADTFQKWVLEQDRTDLDETFANFNEKYEELTPHDQLRCGPKTLLFVQSAPQRFKERLIQKLRKDGELDTDWERVRKTVDDLVSCEILYSEVAAITGTEKSSTAMKRMPEQSLGSMPKPVNSVDDLAKLMNEMRIQQLAAEKSNAEKINEIKAMVLSSSSGQQKANSNLTSTRPSRPYRCAFCDSTTHAHTSCKELDSAVNAGRVMLREGRIVDPKGNRLPLNLGRGGIKTFVEDEKATGTNGIQIGRSYRVEATEVPLRRAAATVRKQTGWDAPVDVDTCRSYVASRETAQVDVRRKHEEMEPIVEVERRNRPRKTEKHFGNAEVSPTDAIHPSSMTPPQDHISVEEDPLNFEVGPKKKSVNFRLASELQKETDIPALLRQRVLKAEVTMPLGSLLGLDGTKFSDELINLLKRRRQEIPVEASVTRVKTETSGDDCHEPGSSNIMKDLKEASCYQMESVQTAHGERLALPGLKNDYNKSYWSRATPGLMIRLEGISGPIPALIDHGSEVNVLRHDLFLQSQPQWPMAIDCGWVMKGANGGTSPMTGACPNVTVIIGDIAEPHHFFVQRTVSFPVILGQPFISKMRLSTKVLDNGVQFALLKSVDNTRQLQVQVVREGHFKNRTSLHTTQDEESDF